MGSWIVSPLRSIGFLFVVDRWIFLQERFGGTAFSVLSLNTYATRNLIWCSTVVMSNARPEF